VRGVYFFLKMVYTIGVVRFSKGFLIQNTSRSGILKKNRSLVVRERESPLERSSSIRASVNRRKGDSQREVIFISE